MRKQLHWFHTEHTNPGRVECSELVISQPKSKISFSIVPIGVGQMITILAISRLMFVFIGALVFMLYDYACGTAPLLSRNPSPGIGYQLQHDRTESPLEIFAFDAKQSNDLMQILRRHLSRPDCFLITERITQAERRPGRTFPLSTNQ